jgi:5-(carboxyamino)imidazole ribonucleotide synthase
MIIGILGCGQLGRMLALAGRPLELDCVFLCPDEVACAAAAGERIRADYTDTPILQDFARRVDVATYEFENVPAVALEAIARQIPVRPGIEALSTGQNRLAEKRLFESLDIPVPPYTQVDSLEDLARAVEEIPLPAVLKKRREGYDGKGQAVVRDPRDIERAWQQIGEHPAILEEFVEFEREVSIIGVRGLDGRTLFYPLSENVHRQGILRVATSLANDPMQAQAEAYLDHMLSRLDYVGVLALELMQANGRLLANEFAPRVHNSGHWTIEGAQTSQFENHLRAVTGLPLGSTSAVEHAAMVNFIGGMPPLGEVLQIPGAHMHDYGKSPRPGRKVGHATLRAANRREMEDGVARLTALADAAGS